MKPSIRLASGHPVVLCREIKSNPAFPCNPCCSAASERIIVFQEHPLALVKDTLDPTVLLGFHLFFTLSVAFSFVLSIGV